MKELYELLKDFVDPVYIGSFILLSYGLRKVIKDLMTNVLKVKTNRKYGVFVIGILLGLVFYGLNKGIYPDEPTQVIIKRLIASYALGTSLYELLIKAIIDYVNEKLSKKS